MNLQRSKRIENAKGFGSIDESGKVYLKLSSSEPKYIGHPIDSDLSLYVNRFVDFEEKVDLFEQRLNSPKSLTSSVIDLTLTSFDKFIEEKKAIGNYDELTSRIDELKKICEVKKTENSEKKKALIEASLNEMNEIVTKVESFVNLEKSRIIWKDAKNALESSLDRWKEIRKNVKLPEKQCDLLWDRFTEARNFIYNGSKDFNEKIKRVNEEVRSKKNLIADEAEKLKDSENLENARKEFGTLMKRWKEAGRGNRKDDDALWKKFKDAQDYFYSRLPKVDAEKVKEKSEPTNRWNNDTSPLSNSLGNAYNLEKLAALKSSLK